MLEVIDLKICWTIEISFENQFYESMTEKLTNSFDHICVHSHFWLGRIP